MSGGDPGFVKGGFFENMRNDQKRGAAVAGARATQTYVRPVMIDTATLSAVLHTRCLLARTGS